MILNTVINKHNEPSIYPNSFVSNRDNFTSKKSIADGFNQFFTNVGPELAANITLPNKGESINNYLMQRNVQSMFLTPVNDQEVTTAVNLYKNKTSTDFNNINMSSVNK